MEEVRIHLSLCKLRRLCKISIVIEVKIVSTQVKGDRIDDRNPEAITASNINCIIHYFPIYTDLNMHNAITVFNRKVIFIKKCNLAHTAKEQGY